MRLLAESGTAILCSSHHMIDVERLAHRVVMLQDRRVFLDCDLDDLRENTCRVIIPESNGATPESLRNLEGFMAARVRGDALHAIFRLDPERAAATVAQGLRTRDLVCNRLPLEELFSELAGGTI